MCDFETVATHLPITAVEFINDKFILFGEGSWLKCADISGNSCRIRVICSLSNGCIIHRICIDRSNPDNYLVSVLGIRFWTALRLDKDCNLIGIVASDDNFPLQCLDSYWLSESCLLLATCKLGLFVCQTNLDLSSAERYSELGPPDGEHCFLTVAKFLTYEQSVPDIQHQNDRPSRRVLLACGTMFSDMLLVDFESMRSLGETLLVSESSCRQERLQLIGRLNGRHRGVIYSIDASSDLSIILTASDDRSIVIWRLCSEPESSLQPDFTAVEDSATARDQQLVYNAQCQLYGHESRVWSVRLHPSCSVFYSIGEDCALIAWSTSDGRLLRKETRHLGRHIWCLGIDPSGAKLVTGGNDGALIYSEVGDRRQTADVCELEINEKDFLRFAFFDAAGNLVALTNDGHILRGSSTDQPRATLQRVKLVGDLPFLQRCSCAALSPNRQWLLCSEEAAAAGGAACCLIDLSAGNADQTQSVCTIWRSNNLLHTTDKDGNDSSITSCGGGILNLCWLSNEIFLVSITGGKLILATITGSPNQGNISVVVEKVNLSQTAPICEWINCGRVARQGWSDFEAIVLGDRSGRLHCVTKIAEASSWLGLHFTSLAHKSGVLHVEMISPLTDKHFRVLSCGKDGTLIGWRLNLSVGFVQESIVKEPGQLRWIERTLQISLDTTDNESGLGNSTNAAAAAQNDEQFLETKLLGFHGRLFKVLDAATLTVEFSADCGGGHRCWDFVQQRSNDRSIYRLCYVKSGALAIVTQSMRASFRIKKGLHGGTINSAVLLGIDGQDRPLVATGSEDCAICTLLCPTSIGDDTETSDSPVALAPLSRSRGHASSVRCLATTNAIVAKHQLHPSGMLISGGGRGGLAAWSVTQGSNPMACRLTPLTACQLNDRWLIRKLASDQADDAGSTRVMSLAILPSAGLPTMLIAACSNGDILLMRLENDDGSKLRFSLIGRLMTLPAACALKVIVLECADDDWAGLDASLPTTDSNSTGEQSNKPTINHVYSIVCSASDGQLVQLACHLSFTEGSEPLVSSLKTRLVAAMPCSVNDVCCCPRRLLFMALDSGRIACCQLSANSDSQPIVTCQSTAGHSSAALSIAAAAAASSRPNNLQLICSLGADCCARIWQWGGGDEISCLRECRLALTDPQKLLLLLLTTEPNNGLEDREESQQKLDLLAVGQGLQLIRLSVA